MLIPTGVVPVKSDGRRKTPRRLLILNVQHRRRTPVNAVMRIEFGATVHDLWTAEIGGVGRSGCAAGRNDGPRRADRDPWWLAHHDRVLHAPIGFHRFGEMAAAYFMAHQARGLWPVQNQDTPAGLFCFAFLYFAARGAGVWSVDAARGGTSERQSSHVFWNHSPNEGVTTRLSG